MTSQLLEIYEGKHLCLVRLQQEDDLEVYYKQSGQLMARQASVFVHGHLIVRLKLMAAGIWLRFST